MRQPTFFYGFRLRLHRKPRPARPSEGRLLRFTRRLSGCRGTSLALGQGVLRNRPRRNQRFPVAARKIRLRTPVESPTPGNLSGGDGIIEVYHRVGRALYRRYPSAVEEALAEQRILIFAVRNARRTGWQTAQTRNYTIATMAEESVYALRTDGRPSSLDVLCGLELGRKPVRCFPQ